MYQIDGFRKLNPPAQLATAPKARSATAAHFITTPVLVSSDAQEIPKTSKPETRNPKPETVTSVLRTTADIDGSRDDIDGSRDDIDGCRDDNIYACRVQVRVRDDADRRRARASQPDRVRLRHTRRVLWSVSTHVGHTGTVPLFPHCSCDTETSVTSSVRLPAP